MENRLGREVRESFPGEVRIEETERAGLELQVQKAGEEHIQDLKRKWYAFEEAKEVACSWDVKKSKNGRLERKLEDSLYGVLLTTYKF